MRLRVAFCDTSKSQTQHLQNATFSHFPFSRDMAVKRWSRRLCLPSTAINDAGPTIAMQVMSDLHLEIGRAYQTYDIVPCAPYLLLAGDVGRLQDYDLYCEFLQRQCARFKKVCLVLGNLEFYGLSRAEGLVLANNLQAEPGLCHGLKILNRTRFDLTPRITILGCTLQPYLPSQARDTLQQKVSDFKRIARWTVSDHNSEHRNDVRWVSMTSSERCNLFCLQVQLSACPCLTSPRSYRDMVADRIILQLKAEIERLGTENSRRLIVIVTHHAPTLKPTSRSSQKQGLWSPDLTRDLLLGEAKTWLGIEKVRYWCFGHTHWNMHKRVVARLEMVSNQRGHIQSRIVKAPKPKSWWKRWNYKDTNGDLYFNPRKVLKLP